MTDHKNTKPHEPLTNDDIIGSIIFVAAVFGGWLIINLI